MHQLEIKSGQKNHIKQSIMALDAALEKHKLLVAPLYYEDRGGASHEEIMPSYKMRYKTMLKTTIEELEKTRRSFKSHQIERLRKRLIQELLNIE